MLGITLGNQVGLPVQSLPAIFIRGEDYVLSFSNFDLALILKALYSLEITRIFVTRRECVFTAKAFSASDSMYKSSYGRINVRGGQLYRGSPCPRGASKYE
jgi:hypothetical protein